MTESKTPVADGYKRLSPGLAHENYLKIVELETALYRAKEDAPSKGVETILALEEVIQGRIKAHEGPILQAKSLVLEGEFALKKIENDRAYESQVETLKKSHATAIETMKQGYEQKMTRNLDDYKSLAASHDKVVKERDKLAEDEGRTDRDTFLAYFEKMKARYNHRHRGEYTVGGGMLKRDVSLGRHDVLRIFQMMLKEVGMDLND